MLTVEPGSTAGDDDLAADHAVAPLTPRQSLASAGVGGAALIAGTIAVFVKAGDIGSGVLLAIGALFLLMAVTRRPIISAKFGDNEIRLAQRVLRQVEEKLDTASEEVRPELAQAVIESVPAAWRPLAVKARWILFEDQLRSELERLIPDATIIMESASGGEHAVDAIVHQGDNRVGIEIKLAGLPLKIDTVNRAVEGATRAGLKSLVIVASSGFTKGAVAEYGGRTDPINVRLVRWAEPGDNASLVQALESLGIQARA